MRRRSLARSLNRSLASRPSLLRAMALGFWGACLAGAGSWALTGCKDWDLRAPFEHNAPEVDEAVRDLDAGKLDTAERTLADFLKTGRCSADGGTQISSDVRRMPNGSFDLGLTLFNLAERFGQRFGDEEIDGGAGAEQKAEKRAIEVGCALAVVRAIASDPTVPLEVRARAHYLAGNLEFLRREYKDAVHEYDQALTLVPGIRQEAGGDGIGRDAAWNRAIALRRIEDQKDAAPDAPDGDDASDAPDSADAPDSPDGNDSGPDAGPDGGDSGSPDSGDKGDGGDKQEPDGGNKGDAGDAGQDAGADGGSNPKPDKPQDSKKSPPQQDNRILEQLEQAPSYQAQEAKQRAGMRRGSAAMEDK